MLWVALNLGEHMSAEIDEAYHRFTAIAESIHNDLKTAQSESDFRLRAIDRLLHEVLGWPRGDDFTEHKAEDGRIDYILGINGTPRLIVEAKSTATFTFSTHHRSGAAYKLDGPVFSGADVQRALEQASDYTKKKHLALCAVTNGTDWVVFLGNRIDGHDYRSGYGFLFQGLAEVRTHFTRFYSLLHRACVGTMVYRDMFEEVEKGYPKEFHFSKALIPSQDIARHGGDRASDIDNICKSFFRDITNTRDPEMLSKCFIETQESRTADARLTRITEHLSSQVQSLAASSAPLIRTIEDTIANKHGEVVMLVGGKGAGKSTFLARFFEHTIPKELKDKCVVYRIDVGQAPEDLNGIHRWLNTALLKEVEEQHYAMGASTADHMQGIFFSDYKRFSERTYKHLYDTDKSAFKVKFGEYLEGVRRDNPIEYIAAFLGDAAKNRKLLPILVFDNVDHHSHALQEIIFQYAISFSKHPFVPVSMTLLPITIRTLWQLSRETTFESFFTAQFYLPAPPPLEVLRRRLSFLHEKVERGRHQRSSEYFLNHSIRVSLESLQQFVVYIQEALVNSEAAARALEFLSNGDTRRLLELTYRLIASPYLKTAELFTSYVSGEPLRIGKGDVLSALIKMDGTAYRAEMNPYVANVFEIVPNIYTSPLLALRLLTYLHERAVIAEKRGQTKERDIPSEEVIKYFVDAGVRLSELSPTVTGMLQHGLIESQEPTQLTYENAKTLSISSAGQLHLEWAFAEEAYIDSMAEITNVHREDAYQRLLDAHKGPREWRSEVIRKEFSSYCNSLDRAIYLIPGAEKYSTQKTLGKVFEEKWRG
jgi:energy-coupling factor transporter ATP-binding protein EcfA2